MFAAPEDPGFLHDFRGVVLCFPLRHKAQVLLSATGNPHNCHFEIKIVSLAKALATVHSYLIVLEKIDPGPTKMIEIPPDNDYIRHIKSNILFAGMKQ